MRTLLVLLFTIPRPEAEPGEISKLHACIEQRFQSRISFGMNRVALPSAHGMRTFRPENPSEQSAVDALRAKGYEVALFLSGRGVLESNAAQTTLPLYRYQPQGPAAITPVSSELPSRDALLAESRKAFAKNEPYLAQAGNWNIALHPLRATGEQCVMCHAGAKVGDELGVVMYLYKLR